MRKNWPSGDLQSAAQGRLRFTAEQSQRMRDEVLRWNAPPLGTKLKTEIHNYSLISDETLGLSGGEEKTAQVISRMARPAAPKLCCRSSTNRER